MSTVSERHGSPGFATIEGYQNGPSKTAGNFFDSPSESQTRSSIIKIE